MAWTAVALIVVVGLARGPADRGRAAARHRHGDLGDPDRPAHVRAGDALLRGPAAGRRQGGGEEPDRRRDPRRHQRDQHRQDRHADAEPDDGLDAVHRRRLVHRRRRGLPQDRRHPCRSPDAEVPDFTRLAYALVLDSDATVGDDGAVIGDPTEAALVVLAAKLGRRRRPDPAGLPPAGARCRSTPSTSSWRPSTASTIDGRLLRRRAGQGCPRRRPGPVHHGRRPASARQPGADRAGARPDRGGQPADGGEGPAGARLRRAGHRAPRSRPQLSADPMCAHPRPRVRRDGGHHRPAAAVGQGGRRDGAAGRHRRPHDHR